MEPLKDAGHFYEVERRQYHAQRPGFCINELQISPMQKVPWHYQCPGHVLCDRRMYPRLTALACTMQS
jgi:hypothetical protein